MTDAGIVYSNEHACKVAFGDLVCVGG